MIETKLKKVKNFYIKKPIISSVVQSKINRDEIVYGAQAINKQLPIYLHKPTIDYDIFTSNPKREAKELEVALDCSFGGDYFHVIPAKHKGTFKVISKVDGETIADFTQPKEHIPYKVIAGVKYIDLDYVIQHIKKTLKDKKAKYRWEKDKDTLNRIKLASKEKMSSLWSIKI